MNKCQTHPRYKGKRKPRTECEGCLAFYIQMYKPRQKKPRTPPPMKDKSKYSRKKKHKDDNN